MPRRSLPRLVLGGAPADALPAIPRPIRPDVSVQQVERVPVDALELAGVDGREAVATQRVHADRHGLKVSRPAAGPRDAAPVVAVIEHRAVIGDRAGQLHPDDAVDEPPAEAAVPVVIEPPGPYPASGLRVDGDPGRDMRGQRIDAVRRTVGGSCYFQHGRCSLSRGSVGGAAGRLCYREVVIWATRWPPCCVRRRGRCRHPRSYRASDGAGRSAPPCGAHW